MRSDTEKDIGHPYDSLYHGKFQTDVTGIRPLHANIGRLLDIRHLATLKSNQHVTNCFNFNIFFLETTYLIIFIFESANMTAS